MGIAKACLGAAGPSARLPHDRDAGGKAGAASGNTGSGGRAYGGFMDWREEGILLAARPHGESSAIIEVFTAGHGRHAGVVRGGAGRRMAPVLQPGAQLDCRWRARLDDHIGGFTVELMRSRSGAVLDDRAALLGLASVLALLGFSLPERQPHPRLYRRTCDLLDMMAAGGAGWPTAYLRWELHLLDELGFGLDLSACAVSGLREGLAYVSPRSGRAVSAIAAGEWAPRLLPLPGCLIRDAAASPADISAGLRLTGHFLEHHAAPAIGNRALPEARARLVAWLNRG